MRLTMCIATQSVAFFVAMGRDAFTVNNSESYDKMYPKVYILHALSITYH